MSNNARTLWCSGLSSTQVKKERRFTFLFVVATVSLSILGAIAFLLDCNLDIRLTRILFENDEFVLRRDDLWSALRRITMIGFFAYYGFVIFGLAHAWRKGEAWLRLNPVQWLYLTVTSLAGPLLLANLILKDFVGRPRPREVKEFGGRLEFKSLFESGGGCLDNCSFVSGEVSSMVMIFASLIFVLPRWRKWLLIVLPLAWFFSAYMRIGQGGHFASDALFAGIFMMLVASGLYRIMVLSDRANS